MGRSVTTKPQKVTGRGASRILLVAGFAICAAATASGTERRDHGPHPLVSDKFIELTTTACLGTCPVYRISILRTGKLLYSGDSCVAVAGWRSAQLTKREMNRINDALAELHVFASPPVCLGCRIKDASFYNVDIWSRGRFARLTAATHLSTPIAPLLAAILQGDVKAWVGKPNPKEGGLSCEGDSITGL
jgi:hypothetical protein